MNDTYFNGSFVIGLIVMILGVGFIVMYNFYIFHADVHRKASRAFPALGDMLPEEEYLMKASFYETGKESLVEERTSNTRYKFAYVASLIIFLLGYLIFLGLGLHYENLNPVQRFFRNLDDIEELFLFFVVFVGTSRLSKPINLFLELNWLEKTHVKKLRQQLGSQVDPVELDQFIWNIRQEYETKRQELKREWYGLKPRWLRNE